MRDKVSDKLFEQKIKESMCLECLLSNCYTMT